MSVFGGPMFGCDKRTKSFACETPRLRRLRQQHVHCTPQCNPPEGFYEIGKRGALSYFIKKPVWSKNKVQTGFKIGLIISNRFVIHF